MREGGGRGVGDKVAMRANYRLLGLGVHDLLGPWQSWNVVCRVRNQTRFRSVTDRRPYRKKGVFKVSLSAL